MQAHIQALRAACGLTEAKATAKQASYAHSLAMKNPDEWTAMAAGLGLGPSPTLDDFKGLEKKAISTAITDLKSNKKATQKQIGFALSLMMQMGREDWKSHGFHKSIGTPNSAKLRKMSMPAMSALINDLKEILVN